ncbi:MAG: TauD/TfdA family dioxygenase [Pseudomonadota bacterium]|nr:TauD/TfdA family dioxygenase [Pseudomonadota bacterium]
MSLIAERLTTLTDPALRIVPLDAPLGCRIEGVDLSGPVSATVATAILDAFHAYQLVVFPGQNLDEGTLVRATHLFGEPVIHHVGEYLDVAHPEVMRLSNNEVDGKPLGAPNNGINWHSDQIFRERPMLATLLYGARTPATTGGDTLFSNMYLAHDALPPRLQQRLKGVGAAHSFVASYDRNYIRARKLSDEEKAANPEVIHPAIRTHPVTGRKALFVDPDSVTRLVGLDTAEGEDILAFLFEHIADTRFVYRHRWTQGELVAWDNRCLLHRATTYDDSREIRLMFRTQTQGDRPW